MLQGRGVTNNEMLQLQLRYPEVETNIRDIKIQTTCMELRAGVERTSKYKGKVPGHEDGTFAGNIVDIVRRKLRLITERQMRNPELLIASNAFQTTVSIDYFKVLC